MKKVIALILAAAMIFALCACSGDTNGGGGADGDEPEVVKRDTAEETVVKALQALRDYDIDAAMYYWGSTIAEDGEDADGDSADNTELFKAMFKNISCEIISAEENETTATVVVAITNIDLKTAMADAISASLAIMLQGSSDVDEDTLFATELLKAIEFGDYDSVTMEATVNLDLIDDKWVISEESKEAVMDAVLADAMSLFE